MSHVSTAEDCLDLEAPRPCMHCGADPLIVSDEDDDDRCVACGKTHLVCDACDDIGAEICICCADPFCSKCWDSDGHREHCRSCCP